MNKKELYQVVLNWKTGFFSIFLVGLAIVILWVSETLSSNSPIFWGRVVPSFAAILASSGVFALIYEVFIRQAQTKFVLESIELKESMLNAGLDDISVNYLDFDYAGEIIDARHIRVFALYAHSWLNRYSVEISDHLLQKGSSFTLVVPSFDNRFLEPLAAHFQYTPDQMKNKIAESIASVAAQGLKKKLGEGSSVSIYMHADRPCYSMYHFDDRLLVGTYYSSRARRRSPMFLFSDKPGSMYSEFCSDLDQVIDSDSDLIYCSKNKVCKLHEVLGDHLPLELKGLLEKTEFNKSMQRTAEAAVD